MSVPAFVLVIVMNSNPEIGMTSHPNCLYLKDMYFELSYDQMSTCCIEWWDLLLF